jgi:hypothetical protein
VPWSDYPKDIRPFSGLVQAAAEARFGAAATVQLISQAARDAGIKLSFQSFSGISKLYGSYVGVRNARSAVAQASEVVNRTGIDQGITGAMISRAPYSPSLSTSAVSPFVLVKGRYTMDSPTGPLEGFFTHQYRLSEVNTISGVIADMQAQMENSNTSPDLSQAQLEELVSIEWSPA